METRGSDSFVIKDDQNHNYRSTRVILDSKAVCGAEAEAQRGGVRSVGAAGSDSGSDSSEAGETDGAAMSAMAEGRLTLDSTPKLREWVHSCMLTPGPQYKYIDGKQGDGLSLFHRVCRLRSDSWFLQ